jgi:hypothetical protein
VEQSRDATNKNISPRREERLTETQREGLEYLPFNSSILGDKEPLGTCDTNSTRENPTWKLTPIRDTTAGKILERLELLEKETLSYIRSHQARLEARLGESKQTEEKFLKESNQIKSDIYHLAVAQQNSNGNGHQ